MQIVLEEALQEASAPPIDVDEDDHAGLHDGKAGGSTAVQQEEQ